eukprot:4457415-Pyramimonas_sp.AAC.1
MGSMWGAGTSSASWLGSSAANASPLAAAGHDMPPVIGAALSSGRTWVGWAAALACSVMGSMLLWWPRMSEAVRSGGLGFI